MPVDNDAKFRREFTADQLKGRHHITITPPALNAAFLEDCARQRRVPADLIRIMLEDRYANEISEEVHYPKSVEAKPHGGERSRKHEVA